MTNGVFQLRATPSESAISNRRHPDVNKDTPGQSIPDARGWSPDEPVLGGSFGTRKIARKPTKPAAPAMTKNTTFQFAHSEIIPP